MAHIRFFLCVRDNHDLFNGRQVLQDIGDTIQRINIGALEKVSISSKKNFWFDLTKAVKDTFDAEIGGAGRPCSPKTGRRKHGDDRLGHVGHETHYPVAGHDAGQAQPLSNFGHCTVEFPVGKGSPNPVFAAENERGMVIPVTQQVFREVQPAADKPLGAGHFCGLVDDPVKSP